MKKPKLLSWTKHYWVGSDKHTYFRFGYREWDNNEVELYVGVDGGVGHHPRECEKCQRSKKKKKK